MDRRLAGVLAICLVVSTTITLFVIGERASGATVVENAFPDALYRSREKSTLTFHHGAVSRQRFVSVAMDFYALEKTDANLTLDLDDCTLDRLSEVIPKISVLSYMAKSLGTGPNLLTLNVKRENRGMALKLVDFTNVFEGFAPMGTLQFPEGARSFTASPSPTLCFAFLFDGSGKLNSTYEGIRDFFFDRDMTVENLFIRRNEVTSSFTSSRPAPQPEGKRLLDAPKLGHVAFEEVDRDDRLEVGFSVNPMWLPGRVRTVQLIMVRGDCRLLYNQANFIY